MRYPEASTPAIIVTTPDEWSLHRETGGKIVITAPDDSIVLTATLLPFDGELDALANSVAEAAKATEPQTSLDASISSYEGYSYTTRLKSDPDTVFRIITIQVANSHAVVVTQTMKANIAVEKAWAAENVILRMRVIR